MPATEPRHVIVEILRNAQDGINKTKLYKAFYLAHLVYTDNTPGLLTDWPIAHMPKGPGISDSHLLLDALQAEGYLKKRVSSDGLYQEHFYTWTGKELPGPLAEPVAEAIRRATRYVLPKTATEISNITHENSRSWIEGQNGDTLEIYTDLIDDDEYDRRNEELDRLQASLDDVLKESQ